MWLGFLCYCSCCLLFCISFFIFCFSDISCNRDVQEPPKVPRNTHKQILEVHRLNVKREMIDIFRDPSIMDDDLAIVVIDSRGKEEIGRGIGVLRDILSLFWKEAYDSLFIGENERVPFVRHDYQRQEWASVGRIVVKGHLSCQYLALLTSPAFLAYLLWGEAAVTGPMLIQLFRNYVSANERFLIDKCISFDIDYAGKTGSALLEMLSSYDCCRQVNLENIVAIIEIAHKELIEKPQYNADSWKGIISPLMPSFPNLESLSQRYECLIPSISKLLSCIEANPANDGERKKKASGFSKNTSKALILNRSYPIL